MKTIPLILILILPSCMSAGPRGFTAIGTNASHVTWTPNGVEVRDMNNSESFRELASTARSGLTIWGTTAVAKSTIDAYKSTRNAVTAADVSKVRATEITKRTAIGADVEKTRILNPVEPVPAP